MLSEAESSAESYRLPRNVIPNHYDLTISVNSRRARSSALSASISASWILLLR